MQTDSNLVFVASGSPQAILGVTVNTNPLDLAQGTIVTGANYPTSLSLTFGNATYFGEDLGIGYGRLPLAVWTGAAFAGGTSLNIQIQGAVDNGGGTVAGLTFNTYAESGAQPLANLGANLEFPMPDWPQAAIKLANPRFIRLAFVPVGTFTAGTIAFAGFALQRPSLNIGSYPSAFSVGA